MSLAKNLGGRVGVKENFWVGEGSLFFSKISPQICENLESAQNFSPKGHFFKEKRLFFPKKGHFFQKILLREIFGWGRVAFNKNFHRGEGIP